MQKRSPRIAVVPGDGIGVEVIAEGVRVIQHLAPDIELEHFDLGADRYLRDGVTLPDDVFARWRDEFDAIFLGALGDPRVPSNVHAKEILLGARFRYDLYINQRPIRLLDARKCPLKGKGPEHVDIMVFRENTEGLYTAVGGVLKRDTPDEVAQEACIVTRKGVERIIRAGSRSSWCHRAGSPCARHGWCAAPGSCSRRHRQAPWWLRRDGEADWPGRGSRSPSRRGG